MVCVSEVDSDPSQSTAVTHTHHHRFYGLAEQRLLGMCRVFAQCRYLSLDTLRQRAAALTAAEGPRRGFRLDEAPAPHTQVSMPSIHASLSAWSLDVARCPRSTVHGLTVQRSPRGCLPRPPRRPGWESNGRQQRRHSDLPFRLGAGSTGLTRQRERGKRKEKRKRVTGSWICHPVVAPACTRRTPMDPACPLASWGLGSRFRACSSALQWCGRFFFRRSWGGAAVMSPAPVAVAHSPFFAFCPPLGPSRPSIHSHPHEPRTHGTRTHSLAVAVV